MRIIKRNVLQWILFGWFAITICLAVLFCAMPKEIAASASNILDVENQFNEDYVANKVLVGIKQGLTKNIDQYLQCDFWGDDVCAVKELTENTRKLMQEQQNGKVFDKNIPVINPKIHRTVLCLTLKTEDKQNILNVIKRLIKRDEVEIAEQDYYEYPATDPNDNNYKNNSQWGLNGVHGISAPLAWNISTGSTNVKVGVIDTGIDATHPDLVNRVNASLSRNFSDDSSLSAISDFNSHGTHVAGIIGAEGNNQIGICGVNWDVDLISLKVYNNKGSTDISQFVNAVDYAQSIGIQILNNSNWFRASSVSSALLNNAVSCFDGLFVTIAGNANGNNDNSNYMMVDYSLSNVISVGSIDSNGERSEFSNYGKDSVKIYAPGGNIYSTLPGNAYGYKSGTSMAAPHVAGVAALMLSVEPKLTAARLKDILLSTADSITINTPDGEQSVKKLNAYEAVKYVNQPNNLLFAGGTGMTYDPYLISTEEQFRNMEFAHRPVYITYQGYEEQINYSFKLTQNITLGGDWTAFPYKFSGEFDGGGHYIEYSTEITQADLSAKNFGLFGYIVSPGKIKNLHLRDCRITSDVNTTLTCSAGTPSIGILAGSIFEVSQIENIVVTNPYICCNISNAAIGGIAGSTGRTAITDCTVSGGNIISYSGQLGGMVGLTGMGEIGLFYGGSCNTTIRKNNYSDSDLVGPIIGNSSERSNVSGTTIIETDEDKCIAAGTLITLADGRQVPVETLTGNEMLLVWNLQTGTFDTAPILFIDSDPWQTYKVIDLAFSDGTSVKVIYEHGFWDYDLNKYVYFREDAGQYIGHWFNKQTVDGNGNFISERVQLTGVEVRQEYTAAYSPVTYGHLCYYVNGMLSMPGGIGGLFNTFEVDAETMKYDTAKMQADIEEYGLFTYEEFYELVPVTEQTFEAFNGKYLKVAIGKGLIDFEKLNALAVRYAEFLS